MDRLLGNNNVVKIVALLLAISLWFVVNGGETSPSSPQYKRAVETYRISEVSLTAKVDKNRFAIVKMPKTVTVELKGAPASLNQNIDPNDYEVYVDLSSYKKGTWMVPVNFSGFPSDLTVRTLPEKVEVVLEEKQMVEKEVTAQFIGNIAGGYSLGEAIMKPKKVHVTLPESKIKNIGQVQASINVEAAKDLVEQTVPLRVLDKNGNVMEAEINPAVVEIRVPVTSPYKMLPVKLSYINQPPPGYSIESIRLVTDKITVYGPVEVIDKMNFYPGPQIDLSTFTEDRYLQLKVPLLPNVVKTEPDFIELEIKVSKAAEKTIESIPISVTGLGTGLRATFLRPADGLIDLTLAGSSDNMNELSREDIDLFVDVSNLPPGEHEVPVHMNLPSFVTAKEEADALRAQVNIQREE
ncbi:YbbR-like domain-containing protein [Ammoniphilus sp. 3BR4]|uniref:CdaR family protein n=1 Tax=Ammoniphilus sp. 3BR4 TaxID=3158265 RepID=UPI003465E2EF